MAKAVAFLLGVLSCVSALAVERRDQPSDVCHGADISYALVLTDYAPALSFCSSTYPPATSTLTLVDTASTVTVTSTGSNHVSTSTFTTISTITASESTDYALGVVSSTLTSWTIITVESGTVSTLTITSTATLTVNANHKRSMAAAPAPAKRRRNKCKPPTPEEAAFSRLQSDPNAAEICSCIETSQVTSVTSTYTPIVSEDVVATSVKGVVESIFVTTTPITTIVQSSTDVAIVTESSISTSVKTSTTTKSIMVSTTATIFAAPSCESGVPNVAGAGGCSINCYCDQTVDGRFACDNASNCGPPCTTNDDCLDGYFCAAGGVFAPCPGGTSCVSYVTCTSTYRFPLCDPNAIPNEAGGGGCSSNCYCDDTVDGRNACDNASECSSTCNSNSDCAPGYFCATGGIFVACANGRSCVPYTSCTSTYGDLAAREMDWTDHAVEAKEDVFDRRANSMAVVKLLRGSPGSDARPTGHRYPNSSFVPLHRDQAARLPQLHR